MVTKYVNINHEQFFVRKFSFCFFFSEAFQTFVFGLSRFYFLFFKQFISGKIANNRVCVQENQNVSPATNV
jgi:hypothetical protein